MSQMYYAKNPDAAHDIYELQVNLLGTAFRFLTDAGVFSKRSIDFGTQFLLETLDFSTAPAGDLLDVGCGYGPIGITLAKTAKRSVLMVDINQRAVDLAKKNIVNNHVENIIVKQSNLFENIEGEFIGVISNPPIRAGKRVVHEILEKSFEYLLSEGTLTIVIQKKQGAKSAKAKMIEVFGNVNVLAKKKGYYILQSQK
ncbi:MAG: class I SAM-dependent methyltransferase [Streptococcaceae bacterium]|jgi:16S rRNA (guanine1207-N2)-methyltransferase|nr:class I SAM-dependent methyltransferase [Streptococcaceae bacterium]